MVRHECAPFNCRQNTEFHPVVFGLEPPLGVRENRNGLTQNQSHLTAQTVVRVKRLLFVVLFLVFGVRTHDTAGNDFGHFDPGESTIDGDYYGALRFSHA